MNDEEIMRIAINEARKSVKCGDIPVGAIITKDNKIIAKAYNQKEKKNSVISHAEIIAINKASKHLKNYRLDDCAIYTTKEPCLMCMGVILSSRISKIVYGAKDSRFGTENLAKENNFNHTCEIKGSVLEEECSELLTDFFKKLRSKNESSRKNKNNRKTIKSK